MPLLLGFLFLISVVLPGCATAPHAPSQQTAAPVLISPIPLSTLTHAVTRGQTLWRIAKIYNVDVDDLARANRLPDATHLAVGQILALPKGAAAEVNAPAASPADGPADFVWPVKGKIISYYRERKDGLANKGIDIATNARQDIAATRAGKVVFVGPLIGYGTTIIIDHRDGFSSVYCGPASVKVSVNDDVMQGAVIASAGSTPRADDSLLHFEIRRLHRPQNPLYFLG